MRIVLVCKRKKFCASSILPDGIEVYGVVDSRVEAIKSLYSLY
jgi:hypothetical protein